jgi:hypothetical protein
MKASLLVYGPAIAHSELSNARLIDIAPTIAGWLGFEMNMAEGQPLPILLRRSGEHTSTGH